MKSQQLTNELAPAASQEPAKSPARWLAPGVLAAVALLFFWRYFLLDQTLYAGDTAFVFVPFRQFLESYLAAGKMPLWNPYLFGGTPALAETQYQVLYPINLLLVPLGAARGMGWTLALHVAWMGWGTYLFLRASLGVGRGAALFGAVAFAFGACIQSRFSMPVYTDAAAWLPWILWGYERARARGGAWIVASPVFLALQLCTGGAQYSYYTMVLLLAYHFAAPRLGGDAGWSGGKVVAWTLVTGVTLAMAQLLPELELARLSDRGTLSSYDYATTGSLAPHHFALTTLFPKFYGLYSTNPLDGFIASSESSYLGAATLGLIGAATALKRRRVFWFWAGVGLLALAMALGRNNPIYPLLYRFLPGTSTFRAPGLWLLVVSFCGATLAAAGLQTILDGNVAARARALAVSAGCFAATAIVLLSPLGALIYATPENPFAPWWQVALFAGVTLIFALAWKTPRALSSLLHGRRLGAVLLLVLVFDLFAVSQDMELNDTVLSSDLETEPPAVSRLKAADNAVAPARFWNDNPPLPLESWQVSKQLSTEEANIFRGRQSLLLRSLMPSCMPASHRAFGLTGAWGALMPIKRNPIPIYRDTAPQVKLRWLRLLGVGYHLSYGPPSQPDFVLVSTDVPAIYRDSGALPRAFWVGKAVPVTMQTALATVSAPGFDVTREVALESAAAPLAASPLPMQSATFASYGDARLEMQVNAPASGYLVLMDSFYPGWHARVDGRETPIVPANFTGRAVEVGTGNHRVEMWFEPESVRLGIFISLLSLGLLSSLAAANWSRARGSNGIPNESTDDFSRKET